MKKMLFLLAFVLAFGFPFPAFSQDWSRQFQKTDNGTGYYRSLGVVRDREAFLSRLTYTRDSLSGAQYKSIITGKLEFISFPIDVSDAMKDTVIKTLNAAWDKAANYNPDIHNAAYEFIFPYENERGRPCYKIVVVLPQETWTFWDWVRVWNILMPY
ncbi:MAG: hypothetical protein LBK66_09800 [Spirochaetaceae bacterium]|jgi:hypothetical protein|nr:hypothetical protein [Spirochaetaceae bacterium]